MLFLFVSEFQSLAPVTAAKHSNKKNNQVLYLAEFATYGFGRSNQLTQLKSFRPEDLLNLPTGTPQRSAEDPDSCLIKKNVY